MKRTTRTRTALTFKQLRVGQQFRVQHDSRGETAGGGGRPLLAEPLVWSEAVYTKIRRGVCKDADGQWLDVKATTVVQPVRLTPTPEEEAEPCPVCSPDGYECDGKAGHEGAHWTDLEPLDEDDGHREWTDVEAQAAHEADDPHCTCNDCILSHVSRLADPDPDAACDHCGRRLGTCGNCGQLVCFECHDRDVCRMGQDDGQDGQP